MTTLTTEDLLWDPLLDDLREFEFEFADEVDRVEFASEAGCGSGTLADVRTLGVRVVQASRQPAQHELVALQLPERGGTRVFAHGRVLRSTPVGFTVGFLKIDEALREYLATALRRHA